jgi:anaerobic magnesium-protoporphyrin IX monomethyl ester cyclase
MNARPGIEVALSAPLKNAAQTTVVLINPGWPMKYGNIGALPDLYPALGIAAIGALLRESGFPVSIIDMPFDNPTDEEMITELKRRQPTVVGLTAVTMTYPVVVRLARLIRRELPAATVVAGGIHVTDSPEEALAEPAFHYSVCGPGEYPMLALCEGICRGEVPGDIPGVGYNLAEPAYRVPPAFFSYDGLPPTAYDLYPMAAYREQYGHMSILTSHGCNARCIFCTSGNRGTSVRFVPLDRIRTELNYIVRECQFRYVNIYDSNFTYRPERVHQICDMILEDGLDFRWRCFSKTNGVDSELFAHMKAAGCSHVLFGVETSHDRTMRLIRKGSTRRLIQTAFSMARDAGLRRVAYSIVGLPGETFEDILETIDFIQALDAEFNVVSPISLMPGTPLMDDMDMYGMVALESDWSKGSQEETTATNGQLTGEEIQELVDHAYTRLNNGRQSYDWHAAVEADPRVCPRGAMMSLLDPAPPAN